MEEKKVEEQATCFVDLLSILHKKVDANSPIAEIKSSAAKVLTYLRDCEVSGDVGSTICYSVRCLLDSAQILVHIKEENEGIDDVLCQRFAQKAEFVMNFTKDVTVCLNSNSNTKLLKQFLRTCICHIIITCVTHNTALKWTSTRSIKDSKDLQSVLCSICDVSSINHMLIFEKPDENCNLPQDIFSNILKLLKPKLTKTTWKKDQISQHVYTWCLMQIKHPHLGEHLDMVLPPALLFTDDYQVNNKIIGIKCLCHIIKEVDATELKWHNRAGVIYAAVHSQIYSNKAPLLDVVLPCILGILAVVEKSPKTVDSVRIVNRFDEVLQLILSNMEGEQVIALRRIYLKYVPMFVEKMGITIVRHIKRLLRIIRSYLEVSDGQQEEGRLATLNLTNTLIDVAGLCLKRHTDTLLKALLRLLYDSCLPGFNSNLQVTIQIQNSVVDTLKNLQNYCYDEVSGDLKEVLQSEVKTVPKFVEMVGQVGYLPYIS